METTSNASRETPARGPLTPMMQHYLETRALYPGCVLFYRLGDFYELFFEDAVTVAHALNLTLTRRGQDQQAVPMCGVPVSHCEVYLHRLVRQGFRVAVCEQMEDPEEARKRGHKSMVRRQVVRVVTRGTLTEDALLAPGRNNWLVAAVCQNDQWILACADISTGAFVLETVSSSGLAGCLCRLDPAEILVCQSAQEKILLLFPDRAEQTVIFSDSIPPASLDRWPDDLVQALAPLSEGERESCRMILAWLLRTQIDALPRLDPPVAFCKQGMMAIDAATLRHLEVEQSTSGEAEKSLLGVTDRTLSSQGGRLLRARFQTPLARADAIESRLDHVEWWVVHTAHRCRARDHLKRVPDFQRILGRVAVDRASPRDLKALQQGLSEVRALVRPLLEAGEGPCPRDMQNALADCESGLDKSTLDQLLARALADEMPPRVGEGGVIREGYHPALDQLRQTSTRTMETMAALQARYVQETGVASLKIRHNGVVGYYVEVSAGHKARMEAPFVHRQSLSGSVRYTTPELEALEQAVNHASREALLLEQQLWQEVLGAVREAAAGIVQMSAGVAVLDVSTALAELAVAGGYTRPLMEDSLCFEIRGGRHPVVEALTPGKPFVRNDCCLDPEQRLWLVTGPNMGGKSTFLRQTALIVLMAQAGSFVPAEKVRIGVVDCLFSRVGASDDLARGHSTFMVEMRETASILQKATPRSCVIVDEIGRGTSASDGLALAWAVLEYLHHPLCCRGLFATHYHELTRLEGTLPALKCMTTQVQEWQDKIVFLHRMVPGKADRSFGLHVAAMAGLPEPVIRRASVLLEEIRQQGGLAGPGTHASDPLPAAPPVVDPLRQTLDQIDPDALTPREALAWLYALKKNSRNPEGSAL
jgi:DNA mismatch repair protein MutS